MTHNELVGRMQDLNTVVVYHHTAMVQSAGVRREVHAMAKDCAIAELEILDRTRSLGLYDDDSDYWEEQCAVFDGREHVVF